jgi:uncharacterized paraquat-inducible protein A
VNKASSDPPLPTSQSQQQTLLQRAQRAAQIIANPHQYKVCEGCESIVTADTTTCPSCHSYRFDSAPQRIISQAQLLASRLPQTLQPEDLT